MMPLKNNKITTNRSRVPLGRVGWFRLVRGLNSRRFRGNAPLLFDGTNLRDPTSNEAD